MLIRDWPVYENFIIKEHLQFDDGSSCCWCQWSLPQLAFW